MTLGRFLSLKEVSPFPTETWLFHLKKQMGGKMRGLQIFGGNKTILSVKSLMLCKPFYYMILNATEYLLAVAHLVGVTPG